MLCILRNKFLQNTDLATKSVNTGDRHLHEATSDSKWATVAELASKALLKAGVKMGPSSVRTPIKISSWCRVAGCLYLEVRTYSCDQSECFLKCGAASRM